MTPRAVATLLAFFAFPCLYSSVLADAPGASPEVPPVAFTVLHTANGLGELSPCG